MQTPLSQTLAYAVSQLRADFVAFSSRKLEALGITQGLLYFVLYIGRHPGCTPSDLSAALHADSGHTTRSIHKLEETGFVIRKAHPTDRRASVLELTDKGRQTMEASRGNGGGLHSVGRLSAGTGPRRPVPSAPGTAPDPAAPPPVQSGYPGPSRWPSCPPGPDARMIKPASL